MRDLEDLVREGVETAYDLQARDRTASADLKARVIRRGRRRRAGRIAASAVFSLALLAGATSATQALLDRETRVAGRDVPEMGVVRAYEFGGPIASDGRSMWFGQGMYSNDAGDRNSVARADLATEEVVDGQPVALRPHEMVLGENGLLTVSWQGDMPVGGEGHPVRGAVQRIDPLSLKTGGTIEREDSAPYDVAIGRVGGREFAWVVDNGRDELLQIDTKTMEVAATHETAREPVSVYVHDDSVYVTSNEDHTVQRFHAESGEVSAHYGVPGCANDVEIAAGSLWVVDYCGGAVQRLDEERGGRIATIPVRDAPTAVEFAEGLLWVTTFNSVVRIDPDANEVVGDPIYGVHPEGLLYAAGSMWVHGPGGVYRLDETAPPATPTPTPPPSEDPRAKPLPAGVERVDVTRFVRMVAAAGESVWTGLFAVERLDAETGEVVAKTDAGGFVEGLDVDGDLVWALVEVAEEEASGVVAIDGATGRIVRGPVLLGGRDVYAVSIDAAGGVAWVPSVDGTLTGVDPGSNEVARADLTKFFDAPDEREALRVAATDEAAFVFSTSGVIVRRDHATGELEKAGDLGWNVVDVVSDGEKVWVVQQTPRGKTLLWTLDGRTGAPLGEPVTVAEFGFALATQHDGTVWVAHGGTRGGRVTIQAYVDGAGDPVATYEVPNAAYMTDIAASDAGVWLTTGHDFLYKIDPE